MRTVFASTRAARLAKPLYRRVHWVERGPKITGLGGVA